MFSLQKTLKNIEEVFKCMRLADIEDSLHYQQRLSFFKVQYFDINFDTLISNLKVLNLSFPF